MIGAYDYFPLWLQPTFGNGWPNVPAVAEWRRYHFYLGKTEVLIVLLLAYAFTVARRVFQAKVGEEAGDFLRLIATKNAAAAAKKGKKAPAPDDEAALALARLKYAESCWKLVYYAVSVTSASLILILSDWFDSEYSAGMWTHMTAEATGVRTMTTGAWTYQLVCLSFYVHSLYAHLFIEVRRSDFTPMLIHHIVTIFLIGGSAAIGFYRIGIAILWLHDISDVILESTKLAVYRGEETLGNFIHSLHFLLDFFPTSPFSPIYHEKHLVW
jgi:hypothetical protein